MQSAFFYQVNFLSYLGISIFAKALENGLAVLFDLSLISQILIHVLSITFLNYPLVIFEIINVHVGYCTLCFVQLLAQCTTARPLFYSKFVA